MWCYLGADPRAYLPLCELQFMSLLQTQPEIRRIAEVVAKPKRRFR
jgi:hypothetical protein